MDREWAERGWVTPAAANPGYNFGDGRRGTETECCRFCRFRYLIPCNHMMLSQRWAVKERDCYSVSAAKLLALTPICCSSGITLTLGNQERDYILWSKCTHDSSGRNSLMTVFTQKNARSHLSLGYVSLWEDKNKRVSPISFMNDQVGVLFCFVRSRGHFVISVPT